MLMQYFQHWSRFPRPKWEEYHCGCTIYWRREGVRRFLWIRLADRTPQTTWFWIWYECCDKVSGLVSLFGGLFMWKKYNVTLHFRRYFNIISIFGLGYIWIPLKEILVTFLSISGIAIVIELRVDAGHRKIRIHLVWKFLYYQLEDMPLSYFSWKNIGVNIHIVAPWPNFISTPFLGPLQWPWCNNMAGDPNIFSWKYTRCMSSFWQ